jgi:hypothetical protein
MATATVEKPVEGKKSKGKYANLGYFHLWRETEKPIRSRRTLAIGREGEKQKPRRYHIPSEELAKYKEMHEAGDPFPNPHNTGAYHFILEALKKLGVDRRHSWEVFYAKFKDLASDPSTRKLVPVEGTDGKPAKALRTFWQRFRDKDAKGENALDVDGRLRQNVHVLQRMSVDSKSNYGIRINQIGQDVLGLPGACIDVEKDGKKTYIKLNLNPTLITVAVDGEEFKLPVPVNQFKKRRSAPAAEVVKEVRKVVRKAKAAKAETVEVAVVENAGTPAEQTTEVVAPTDTPAEADQALEQVESVVADAVEADAEAVTA